MVNPDPGREDGTAEGFGKAVDEPELSPPEVAAPEPSPPAVPAEPMPPVGDRGRARPQGPRDNQA